MLLDLQTATESSELPLATDFLLWAKTTLETIEYPRRDEMEMTVRLVDETESADLNQQYRGKQGPTNVLSFESDLPPEVDVPLLGDLVICAPVVLQEAQQQQKTAQAHWAHMLVHGVLHLCGYDHLDETEALQMECLEREILASLSYADPYQPQH